MPVYTTKCPRCGTERRIGAHCLACAAKASREYARRNPDKIKEGSARTYAKWREANPLLPREPLLTEEGRLCRTCGERKSPNEFARDQRSPDGHAWRCRTCAKADHARWRNENRDHVRDTSRGIARRAQKNDPDRIRTNLRRSRLKKYNLSETGLLTMWNSQAGKCAICTSSITINGSRRNKSGAQIDHCHLTGKLRSLLCTRCNTGLGNFKDDRKILLSAVTYLAVHGDPPNG